MKNGRPLRVKYIASDILAAALAYTFLFIFRKKVIEPEVFGYPVPLIFGYKFCIGVVMVPLFWLILNYFVGYYKEVFRKSRLAELGQTLFATITGSVVVFFAAILDDVVGNYHNYYIIFLVYFGLQLLLTYLPRLLLTSHTLGKVKKGQIRFNTLLIGGGQPAVNVYQEILKQGNALGNHFIGYLQANGAKEEMLQAYVSCLGTLENLDEVIRENEVEELIIALSPGDTAGMQTILGKMHRVNMPIRAVPGLNDLLTGNVRISNIFDTPLVELSPTVMPGWQAQMKEFFDFTASFTALVILMPVSLILAVAIKLNSRGPVIYSHERIGRYGKPFRIYKFRSMYRNAEQNGPELSNRNDCRVTSVGRFMRKYRLDEIPNFVNVLKGDMSIVGPRPERQFYIDQIVKQAPHYILLQKIKPGITSWGQVKFGYAGDVEQMIRRLDYDLLYLENMSLALDLKIVMHTIVTIFRASGV